MFAPLLRTIDRAGHPVIRAAEYTLSAVLMAYMAFRIVITGQPQKLRTLFAVVGSQIYFTGWEALPLMSLLAVASGSVVIVQAAGQLSRFGSTQLMGQFVVSVLICELAPLLTALIIVARSGAAITCEIGNMKVNHEIDALESMGINPVSYIVFPRVLAGLISQLCLSFIYCVVAVATGFLVLRCSTEMPLAHYLSLISASITPDYIFVFLIKNIFAGIIVAVVCCYQGLKVRMAPSEVPQATTRAVVASMIYSISFNVIVTILFYIKSLVRFGWL
jgi:phospholipid/cholesterol/gamma-HCH transport system permease protein